MAHPRVTYPYKNYVKRILPESVLQENAKIRTGDELVVVNDLILYNSTKEYATQALSNVEVTIRLLLIHAGSVMRAN